MSDDPAAEGRATIHPTAIIEKGARIGAGVHIGPYCTIGPHVELGERVELIGHVSLAGHTSIGDGTRIWPFASIGHQPQDLKFAGEVSRLEIGRDNVIREHVTMNPGTAGGGLVTRIGDGNLFMVGVHIGHDCRVGSKIVFANNATLAGHVEVGDGAILGGLSAVHQFVRIGRLAILGGMAGLERDLIPFGSAIGNRAALGGLNVIGLRRNGFDRETIHAMREAYRAIFDEGQGTLLERAEDAARRWEGVTPVEEVTRFILADSARSFCTPRAGGGK